MKTGNGNTTTAVKNLKWIIMLAAVVRHTVYSVQFLDPCGLDVCRHNTIIIYVNYNYCANNLMSQSGYEGGFRLLLPLK